MKHIRGFENDVAVFALDRFFIRPLVAVVQLSALIPVDGHLVGHGGLYFVKIILQKTVDFFQGKWYHNIALV